MFHRLLGWVSLGLLRGDLGSEYTRQSRQTKQFFLNPNIDLKHFKTLWIGVLFVFQSTTNLLMWFFCLSFTTHCWCPYPTVSTFFLCGVICSSLRRQIALLCHELPSSCCVHSVETLPLRHWTLSHFHSALEMKLKKKSVILNAFETFICRLLTTEF